LQKSVVQAIVTMDR